MHLANWSTGQSGVVKVAVKIPTAKPNTVDEVKKELQREIETMAALNHPNIVHLLGISEGMYALIEVVRHTVSLNYLPNSHCPSAHTISLSLVPRPS